MEAINKALEGLEKAVDQFFAMPGILWDKYVVKFMEYDYRETEAGVFGLFDTPEQISAAARATRDKGYTNFDCLTPFPVHGLEFDMGLKRSKVPYITFIMGITGTLNGFFLMFLVHEQVIFSSLPLLEYLNSYPLNIGGKPTFAWPAMIPIMFELTVLLGGHATFFSMILLSRLYKPFREPLHPEITNDKFCLWIPTDSENYDEEGVKAHLSELGATEITVKTKGA